MANFLRILFFKPVLWATKKFSSTPKRERVFSSLSSLYKDICNNKVKRGLIVPLNAISGRIVIFSDLHKGRKNGADDFKNAEANYLTALDYYYKNGYTYINLGDSEELWENNIWGVKKYNQASFEAEKKFLFKNRFFKIFGNHDLYWGNDPLAAWQIKSIYGRRLKVYEGLVLRIKNSAQNNKQLFASGLDIFLTHGHQGDASSDGSWFSKFFVANIWAPVQALLKINPNTPAYDAQKKTLHNNMMYEWASEQQNAILITGHTHQPVFASLTHLERLYKQLQFTIHNRQLEEEQKIRTEILIRENNFTSVAVDYMNMKPQYFNTGCCCFSDGDITGIEIADGYIRLIKWSASKKREVLEKMELSDFFVT